MFVFRGLFFAVRLRFSIVSVAYLWLGEICVVLRILTVYSFAGLSCATFGICLCLVYQNYLF